MSLMKCSEKEDTFSVTGWNRFPLVYEVNTRAWLADLSGQHGRVLTLADVPQTEFLRWRSRHFDAIWLMGVWQPSDYSRQRALADPELTSSFGKVLPDWQPRDIASSPYSVAGYHVADQLGGDAALAEFRKRLDVHSLKLVLDFVPNHTAVEHPWVTAHPDFYIQIPGSTNSPSDSSSCFVAPGGEQFACGRLLQCSPWSDTLQLNFGTPALQRALIDTLHGIARQCDGVRCDTAITALKDVFHATWSGLAPEMESEFWDRATDEVKRAFPNFLFLAEVYGEYESRLQDLGFDFVYDKPLYDTLVAGDVPAVRQHLAAGWDFTRRLSRFTENHDWARASEIFGANNRAASLLTFLVPGLHIVHDGQIEGRRKKMPVYLLRRPEEPPDQEMEAFYDRLFSVMNEPAIASGQSRVLELSSTSVIGVERHSPDTRSLLCLVNLGAADAEVALSTELFAHIRDYDDLRIVSTELQRPPQLDLCPGGVTVRLRGHEGVVLHAR
jgi:glycosidase